MNNLPHHNRVLSGMRPTGQLHLGHYHGVLKNWVRLQHEHECFFFVADWHALTTHYEDPSVIADSVWDMVTHLIINPQQTFLENIRYYLALKMKVSVTLILVAWHILQMINTMCLNLFNGRSPQTNLTVVPVYLKIINFLPPQVKRN